MEYVVLGIALAGLVVLLFVSGVISERKMKRSVLLSMKKEYGQEPVHRYETGEMENIKALFYRTYGEDSIDDITSSDLELDEIFKRMNYSKSSMGSAVLYKMLRTPEKDPDRQRALEEKISYFESHEEERLSLRMSFYQIGRLRVDLFENLDTFQEMADKNLFKDYLAIVLILISLVLIFIKPYAGILVLVVSLIYNILSYYSERGNIEAYILSFGYINRFVEIARGFSGLSTEAVAEESKAIDTACRELKNFTKRARLVVNQSSATGAGNPLELLLDYAKMCLHVDIIYFYRMLAEVKKKTSSVESLYENLGRMESYIDLAYYRASIAKWCIPKEGEILEMKEAYHPLIGDPVKNSIRADRGVLITGSNASGKSTFLKTVALNVLFAQTIHTVCADFYAGPFYSLFSSMALRDDLAGKDSYFMVEIKAMKRILDFKDRHPDKKVLCFVDEVLRGTNTVERIAASSEILKYLAEQGTLVFAATHDGELTYLLEEQYDNYHFEEEVKDGDVLFNYRLNEGRAVTRNAIRLLGVMGFPNEIIEDAEGLAGKFLEKGEWTT